MGKYDIIYFYTVLCAREWEPLSNIAQRRRQWAEHSHSAHIGNCEHRMGEWDEGCQGNIWCCRHVVRFRNNFRKQLQWNLVNEGAWRLVSFAWWFNVARDESEQKNIYIKFVLVSKSLRLFERNFFFRGFSFLYFTQQQLIIVQIDVLIKNRNVHVSVC